MDARQVDDEERNSTKEEEEEDEGMSFEVFGEMGEENASIRGGTTWRLD